MQARYASMFFTGACCVTCLLGMIRLTCPAIFSNDNSKTVKLECFSVYLQWFRAFRHKMCLYWQTVVIKMPSNEGFCVAATGEKCWARNLHRYKRYVVKPDVAIFEICCKPSPLVHYFDSEMGGGGGGSLAPNFTIFVVSNAHGGFQCTWFRH